MKIINKTYSYRKYLRIFKEEMSLNSSLLFSLDKHEWIMYYHQSIVHLR